jgi:hypothetical protein
MATVNKADLLAKSFGVTEVEIDGVGTVVVRPLTRAEALSVEGVDWRADALERRLLSMAMVEPALTEDEVAEWQSNSPAGQMQPVVAAIVRISGMEEISAKKAYAEFRK